MNKQILFDFDGIYTVEANPMSILDKHLLINSLINTIKNYLHNGGLKSQNNFINDISQIVDYGDDEFEQVCMDINYAIKIDTFIDVLQKLYFCLDYLKYSNSKCLIEI